MVLARPSLLDVRRAIWLMVGQRVRCGWQMIVCCRGFCLWDTKFSNYSVMHSPYGKDIVKQFVASCKKYGVTPCYYMGPNANGYLSNELQLPAEEFVTRQLGMLRELLTNYGTDYVSRLWWDHYPQGCGGLAPCPDGSFPAAWPRFIELVREVSPNTIICPGPDCDGHRTETGVGKYPVWYPCAPEQTNGTELSCGSHAPTASLRGFHPYETCATMHNGWFCKGTGIGDTNSYWTAGYMWDHYMYSVGIGYVNTLNAPPGTTGQIPEALVNNMATFGKALRGLQEPVIPEAVAGNATLHCGNTSADNYLELQMNSSVAFNAVIIVEDLTAGQKITSYAVDFFDATTSRWSTFAPCEEGSPCIPGSGASPATKSIPVTTVGTCGSEMADVNLISGHPPWTHVAGTVQTASACKELCAKDTKCNFWTWHDLDVTPPSYRGKCYVRHDADYTYQNQTHHVSGVCNHTLPGARGPGYQTGIRGQSVGRQMIDWVPSTTASKVRFRCTGSMGQDGLATVRSFSLHRGQRP